MSKIKCPPRDCGFTEQAAGDGLRGSFPYRDFNTENVHRQTISEYLRPGKSNAVHLRDLRAMTGLSGRDIRRMVEWERRHGVGILSGNDGYFLAETPDEVTHFVRQMRSRAKEIMKTAKAVERGANV